MGGGCGVRTGIIEDPVYLEHIRGVPHVETPQRLEIIHRMIEDHFKGRLLRVPARPAIEEELAYIHTKEHILKIASTAGKPLVSLDPDTQTTSRSFEAALKAVGGCLALVDALLAGEIDNGFALVRPPGHHAEGNRAMGFCLFNNVAIAASYARKRHGLQRILIVDWDLHHGNGTQRSFWENDQVLYFSTHQYPYYPGTGALGEVGAPSAQGFTVNCPLSSGYQDEDFAQIFERVLAPVARQFRPDLILVSAGFDTYYEDPLGSMLVTPKGYARMTRILMDLAQELCHGRLLLVLEGGYHLEGLNLSVRAVLKELLGESLLTAQEQRLDQRETLTVVERIWSVQKHFWKRNA
jgi:acetoin utilization deacetylase AcuC-like enzyme